MKNKKHKGLMAFLIAMALTVSSCGGGNILPDDYKYSDLSKYIKLGEYKGLEYKKVDTKASKEEIQSRIDQDLSANAETEEVKSGTVEKDSVVNIDYVGSIDGVEFEGGTAQGQELDIANSTYIAGFAEGIIGHEVGETFDLHVTFPEDYGKEELNGKDAVFKTTINYIIKTKTPEYTDEWVKNNTDFSNKAEYEASLKEEIETDKKRNAEADEQNEVFSQILDNSEILEYPEKELKAREERRKESYKKSAEASGMSFEDFLAQNGMDMDSYETMIKTYAEQTVETELVLHAIAKEEGIEFKNSEYEEYLNEMLKNAGLTPETFEQQTQQTYEEYASENILFVGYKYKKVMEKVMEYSKGV